mmetsp:Transcript_41692/g.116167  ORF Transcript_41692/g.116167 Transcript_41692/m.116167 type:complete len:260 (-) Transcript_41692:1621-2400(-)
MPDPCRCASPLARRPPVRTRTASQPKPEPSRPRAAAAARPRPDRARQMTAHRRGTPALRGCRRAASRTPWERSRLPKAAARRLQAGRLSTATGHRAQRTTWRTTRWLPSSKPCCTQSLKSGLLIPMRLWLRRCQDQSLHLCQRRHSLQRTVKRYSRQQQPPLPERGRCLTCGSVVPGCGARCRTCSVRTTNFLRSSGYRGWSVRTPRPLSAVLGRGCRAGRRRASRAETPWAPACAARLSRRSRNCSGRWRHRGHHVGS